MNLVDHLIHEARRIAEFGGAPVAGNVEHRALRLIEIGVDILSTGQSHLDDLLRGFDEISLHRLVVNHRNIGLGVGTGDGGGHERGQVGVSADTLEFPLILETGRDAGGVDFDPFPVQA